MAGLLGSPKVIDLTVVGGMYGTSDAYTKFVKRLEVKLISTRLFFIIVIPLCYS